MECRFNQFRLACPLHVLFGQGANKWSQLFLGKIGIHLLDWVVSLSPHIHNGVNEEYFDKKHQLHHRALCDGRVAASVLNRAPLCALAFIWFCS